MRRTKMKANWFNQTIDETISNLKTDVENGLPRRRSSDTACSW